MRNEHHHEHQEIAPEAQTSTLSLLVELDLLYLSLVFADAVAGIGIASCVESWHIPSAHTRLG